MAKRSKRKIIPRRRPSAVVMVCLALASIGLGFYLLHSLLANGGGLDDAQREAGYSSPPFGRAASTDEAVNDPGIAGLIALATGLLIAIPIGGGAVYFLRSRVKSGNL